MKNYFSKLIAMGALVLMGASCEDDSSLTTLATVNFSAPIEASPSTIVLTQDNKYQSVTTISWPDVAFPIDAPVTYALQFDIPSDVLGTEAWANAVRIPVGEEVMSKSFMGNDLNDLALALGLPTEIAGHIIVRVEATMDHTTYSEPLTLTVTPFEHQTAFGAIYMPGGYPGGDIATAAALPAIDTGVYQGYVTFAAPGTLDFKFTAERNFDQVYGADDNGNFMEDGPNSLTVPAYGSYQITVNLNTLSYTAVPYSFGIIGTATAGQWNTDTDMQYDHINQIWKWSGPLMSGALKFRLNDSWTINYGANNNDGNTMYLDNQGAYTVSDAGNYEVKFAVTPGDPSTAFYSVTPF